MKKLLLAPALAAVAMFLFGAIFWMSPFPYHALGRVADDTAAADALAKIFPATGTYLIPGAYVDQKVMTSLYERGPSAMVYFVKEGHAAMDPMVLILGYVHYFIVAVLLMMLLTKYAPGSGGYGSRVTFCTLVGFVGSYFINLSDPIWWHQAGGWHLMNAVYYILAFTVAGLVLAKFAKPVPMDQSRIA